MNIDIQRNIPADHPSLRGHFPGNPIVPGIVILDEVVHALAEYHGDYELQGIPSVKFLAPLRPDQVFTIHFTVVAAHSVKFRCTADGQLFAQGQLTIAAQ